MSDEPEVEEIAPRSPKIIPWAEFEREVAEYIEKSIAKGKWGVIPVQSKVYRKPKYYSKDRESHITFDASIEVRPEEAPEQLHFVWLIECKNYPNRTVTVDEVEEFHSKLMQVKGNKGTIVTRVGFDSGAIAFAKSNRIGLATLQKEEWWTLQFSTDGGAFASTHVTTPFFFDDDVKRYSEFSYALRNTMKQFGVPVVSPDIGKRSISFEGGQFIPTHIDPKQSEN